MAPRQLARDQIILLSEVVIKYTDQLIPKAVSEPTPRLFLVQLPYSDWLTTDSISIDKRSSRPESQQNTIKIGTQDGQKYLLLHSDKWMYEYRQHPYDVTRTALRSFEDDPIESVKLWMPDDIQREQTLEKNHYGKHGNIKTQAEYRIVGGGEDDGSLSRLELDILATIRQQDLSAYTKYIWSVAQDATTFPDRPDLRTALQARITASSYTSPAIREAVAAIQGELALLDEEDANWRIIELVNGLLMEAESLVGSLSDEDDLAVRRFELSHQHHALRAQMFTEQELDMVISAFGDAGYLEAHADVEQCLHHPSPQVRERALQILTIVWALPSALTRQN